MSSAPKEVLASGSLTESPSASTPDAGRHGWVELRPSSRWFTVDLRELWRFRQLVYFFAWRDIKVRYKQTVLGAAWAILQPLMTMIVFTFFFGKLAGIRSDGVPYAVWSYCGLLVWQYFSFVVTTSANSLVSNQNLIKKVYFPRLSIPLSITLGGLVDFAVAFSVLLVLMVAFGIYPTAKVLLIAPLLLLVMIVALGVGLWASALNVWYRDVRYTIPFLIQFWMFVSPVAYPASMVPEHYDFAGWQVPLRLLYSLNPMVSAVEGFRWVLLDTNTALGLPFLVSLAMAGLIFVSGLFFFARLERRFADVV